MTTSSRTPSGAFIASPSSHAEIARLEAVAEWLDRRYVDPVVGLLLPGLGDVAGALVGLYGVLVAWRLSVHPVIIARMLLNLAIDSTLGSIPILGAVADFFFHAHIRNVDLLKQRSARGRPEASDWWIVGGALFLFLLALCLPVLVLGAMIALLFGYF